MADPTTLTPDELAEAIIRIGVENFATLSIEQQEYLSELVTRAKAAEAHEGETP